MLPDGWGWVDPVDTAWPWRAETRSGTKHGLAIAIEGESYDRVADAAKRIDDAFMEPRGRSGWAAPLRGGFIP